jgi:hypothetical protein
MCLEITSPGKSSDSKGFARFEKEKNQDMRIENIMKI